MSLHRLMLPTLCIKGTLTPVKIGLFFVRSIGNLR